MDWKLNTAPSETFIFILRDTQQNPFRVTPSGFQLCQFCEVQTQRLYNEHALTLHSEKQFATDADLHSNLKQILRWIVYATQFVTF